ncbi:MAG: hypothetical protein DMG65_09430 [Candidatus Angelobacter sp. Gp1-AA117]|nr:MAG: hypothetical protein DMG65_09430 [Candidatus Angelobacter sp. Gp1-AA117]
MAENKGTHPPKKRTSRRELSEFPEVTGKIVDKVELFSDHEYYAITIRFQDKTSLHFAQEPAVFTFPRLSDWADGNETILQEYKSVRSNIQTT